MAFIYGEISMSNIDKPVMISNEAWGLHGMGALDSVVPPWGSTVGGSSIRPDCNLTLYDSHGNKVAEFNWDNGVLTFSGKADETMDELKAKMPEFFRKHFRRELEAAETVGYLRGVDDTISKYLTPL